MGHPGRAGDLHSGSCRPARCPVRGRRPLSLSRVARRLGREAILEFFRSRSGRFVAALHYCLNPQITPMSPMPGAVVQWFRRFKWQGNLPDWQVPLRVPLGPWLEGRAKICRIRTIDRAGGSTGSGTAGFDHPGPVVGDRCPEVRSKGSDTAAPPSFGQQFAGSPKPRWRREVPRASVRNMHSNIIMAHL